MELELESGLDAEEGSSRLWLFADRLWVFIDERAAGLKG